MKTAILLAAGSAAIMTAGAANADIFNFNYEAPGVQTSTATFSVEGIETFDSQPLGVQSFTTDFGTAGAITGVYTGVQVNPADRFGGAGGTGNYAAAYGGAPYTVTLTADPVLDPQGINYFGYWLSALDPGNQVTFSRGGVVVGSLNPGQVTAAVAGNPAYYGNPNPAFLHQDPGEPFVFINFYDTNGTFDTVTFTENPAIGGYESDNQTVGFYTAVGGVPEPAAWALMLLGLGVAGAVVRGSRRRSPLGAS